MPYKTCQNITKQFGFQTLTLWYTCENAYNPYSFFHKKNFYYVPVCKTNGGANPNTQCIFPFKYKGKRYNTCTLKDADNVAWCSTQVDKFGNHIRGKGKWGNCGEGCPLSTSDLIGE